MAKITFGNKTTLNPQPSIARENKVIDEDINEIKSVVNENAGMCELSTTEINTGKTWIDGKTIYSKVLSFTTSSSLNTFIYEPHNISNLDTVLPNYSMTIKFNDNWYKAPNDIVPEILVTSTDFGYYNSSSNFAGKPAVAIIEYTKNV